MNISEMPDNNWALIRQRKIEAEKNVLGIALKYPLHVKRMLDTINEDYFTFDAYKDIFDAIKQMNAKGREITASTVMNCLNNADTARIVSDLWTVTVSDIGFDEDLSNVDEGYRKMLMRQMSVEVSENGSTEEAMMLAQSLIEMDREESKTSDLSQYLHFHSGVSKQKIDWVVPNWIPRGEITLLSGDGGVGKSFLTVAIAASVTNGARSPLTVLPSTKGYVIIINAEDDVKAVLKERGDDAGVDGDRLIYIDPNEIVINLGSQELENLMDTFKSKIGEYPALVIYDPIEAFLPDGCEMSKRNQMRKITGETRRIAHKFNCAFVIVSHTNKKGDVSGRGRIADSADLWDSSRSVIIAGSVPDEDTIYLSHEKSNYCKLNETQIARVDGKKLVWVSTSKLKDADYVAMQHNKRGRNSERVLDAKETILGILENAGGELSAKEFQTEIQNAGISRREKDSAVKELQQTSRIRFVKDGKVQRWCITNENELTELPPDTPVPFDSLSQH